MVTEKVYKGKHVSFLGVDSEQQLVNDHHQNRLQAPSQIYSIKMKLTMYLLFNILFFILNTKASENYQPNLDNALDTKIKQTDEENPNLFDALPADFNKIEEYQRYDETEPAGLMQESQEIKQALKTTALRETCRSGKPSALIACLEYIAWTEEDVKAPQTEQPEKRRFFSWAGKRNGNRKVADIPKRIPFHSWGGKRSNPVSNEKVQTSRIPFNAWGGKRFVADDYDAYDSCKRSKLKFHSWGGKRDILN